MTQAYEMAVDALGLALTCREKEQQPFPDSSDPTVITPEPDSFPVVIEFDMLAYKKRTSSRAVKKTLSAGSSYGKNTSMMESWKIKIA